MDLLSPNALLLFLRLCLIKAARGAASQFQIQASGKAKPFRTSGGKAASHFSALIVKLSL
jgi:hypothetical protein